VSTTTIQVERRAVARKMLNPLPYINLPSDNGGIVLDVSEDGLRFRALSPMEQSGAIPFWFTAHSNRIEGEAELVWLDDARKTGGLRFTQLAADAREQIRAWPGDPNLRPSVGEDFALHIYAPEPAKPRWKWDWRAALAPLSAGTRHAGLWMKSFTTKIEAALLPMIQSGRSELRALRPQDYLRETGPRILRVAGGVVLGIVVLTLSYSHRRQAGDSLIWLGMKISGQAHAVASAPASPAQVSQAEGRSAGDSLVANTPAQAAPQPLTAAAATGPNDKPAAPAAPLVPALLAPAPNLGAPKLNASGTELLVQVAALTDESGARDLAETLRRENFPAAVRVLPVDSLYRVVLGPYSDKGAALNERGKLHRAGFHAFIRREPAAELSDLTASRPASF
jgi:SPOR domain